MINTVDISAELEPIVARLVAAFAPDQVFLFGSYARGDDGPDSDYDVMVIVETSDLAQYERSQRAYAALRGLSRATDVLIWTRAEFDSRVHLVASLPATILREGVCLYDRNAARSSAQRRNSDLAPKSAA